jgi:hypothetical protein
MSLINRYLLARVTHKCPKATRTSRTAQKLIAEDARDSGAKFAEDKEVGRGIVELYEPGSLRYVNNPFHGFYTYHDRVTSEYIGKGPKLLSIQEQPRHAERFYSAKLEFQRRADEWCKDYAAAREKNARRLGKYFRESDYPSPEVIHSYWQFDCSYQPIGDPASFELGAYMEEQRKALQAQLKAASDRAAKKATETYRQDLIQALDTLAQKMRGGKGTRLSDSLLLNLQELVRADLNASDSPELTAALADIDAVSQTGKIALSDKKNQHARDRAALTAESMAAKLKGLTPITS